MLNEKLEIIAGPCSVDEKNIEEIYEISKIEVENRKGALQRAVAGTRVVGLKSRTALEPSGDGLGIDYPTLMENLKVLSNGGKIKNLKIPPSVKIAQRIVKETSMLIATEIMMPEIQLPLYEGKIGKGKFMPWNPAVNQLGWQILQMVEYTKRNDWLIGIKNGKWVGENLRVADTEKFNDQTSMEKTWIGLTKYAKEENVILIHRGVDVPDKGNYRNAPVHQIAKRVKLKTKAPLYFDPSHSYGPKMKEEIVPAVIEAMKMNLDEQNYLYDGILIEVGTSQTDTEQHISVDELKFLVNELAKFRDLTAPI